MSWCPAGRMFTVKDPASRSAGQVPEVRAGLNVTRAGSSDNDAKDWHVKPAGPWRVALVMIVRPLAKVPKISRSRRGARSDVTVMGWPLVWIVTSPNHRPPHHINHALNGP